MAKIIKKVVKEIDEVVGYKCDICGNDIPNKWFSCVNKDYDMNILEYTTLSGGWGEKSEHIKQHICSKKCLMKALRTVPFDCDVHLTNKLIEDIIK